MAKSKNKDKKLPHWLKKDGDKDGDKAGDKDVKEESSKKAKGKGKDKKNWGKHMLGEKKKSAKSNSKKGPKAWGKNLYGEDAKGNIIQYIKNVTEKNYAEANKYLQAALEDKMKQRIQTVYNNQ